VETKIAVLTTTNLTKSFGGLIAVNDANMLVDEGELRAVIGPNGSGKTTLLNLISGHLKCTCGKIMLYNEDVTHLPPNIRASRGLARTFQHSQVFPRLTIIENLWVAAQRKRMLNPLGDYKTDEEVGEKVEETLKLIRLSHKSDRIASECSYGEQRRIEIGIALINNPKITLMDEPTAGISPQEREEIVNLLKNLKGLKTMLIVEHNVDVVMRIADKVTVLCEGRIVAEGLPKEVMACEEVQKAYIGG